MESSDVLGADTARLTQASEQAGMATRQDTLREEVKPDNQNIKETANGDNEAAATHDGDGDKNVDNVGDLAKDLDDLAVEDEPAKKKRKKKSKSSKKRQMITGFEGTSSLTWLLRAMQPNQMPEFYCDAPVTPEQATEEQQTYAS